VRGALAERSVPDPDEALQQVIAEGAVLVFQDGVPQESEDGGEAEPGAGPGEEAAEQAVPVLLGLDRYALAEESLADSLARLAKTGADARWEAAAIGMLGGLSHKPGLGHR
ncbi:DNA helicase RecD, partial [Streptomyces sp. NPDC051098]